MHTKLDVRHFHLIVDSVKTVLRNCEQKKKCVGVPEIYVQCRIKFCPEPVCLSKFGIFQAVPEINTVSRAHQFGIFVECRLNGNYARCYDSMCTNLVT